MVWIIAAVIVIGLLMDSTLGKIILGIGVAGLGLWLVGLLRRLWMHNKITLTRRKM